MNPNKRQKRSATVVVNGTLEGLIEHATIHFYKETHKSRQKLDGDLVGRIGIGGCREL